jgi:iron-sulfur cluster assembly accessory protein
VLLINLYYNF